MKHHLISLKLPDGLTPEEKKRLHGRTMLVNKYKVFPVECIVRGYITGSSWAEYEKKGTVHGMPQPAGLQRCQAFPDGPIYTPSTKAPAGEKDENITTDEARKIVGDKYADKIENLALSIYKAAHAYAVSALLSRRDTLQHDL